MRPQSRAVLEFLRSRPEGITSRDAWLELGVSRLAARVSDLARDGYTIESELVTVRSGDRIARVARYTLQEQLRLPI